MFNSLNLWYCQLHVTLLTPNYYCQEWMVVIMPCRNIISKSKYNHGRNRGEIWLVETEISYRNRWQGNIDGNSNSKYQLHKRVKKFETAVTQSDDEKTLEEVRRKLISIKDTCRKTELTTFEIYKLKSSVNRKRSLSESTTQQIQHSTFQHPVKHILVITVCTCLSP